MKILKRYNYLIILCIFSIIFFPKAVGLEAQGDSEAIVMAVGVDKVEQDFEVTIQVLLPSPGNQYKQEINTISAKADNVAEAINQLALRIGKRIGIAHCKVFVVSDSTKDENLVSIIDYMLRSKINTNNIVLINTPESSKEFLKTSKDLENSLYFAVNNNAYNKTYIDSVFISLDKFVGEYLSPASCSIVDTISLGDAKDLGVFGFSSSSSGGSTSSTSSSSSGSGDSGGGEQSQKVINNKGEGCIYKKGKKILDLSPDQTKKLNMLIPENKRGYLYIENVNDDLYKNSTVVLEMDLKKVNKKLSFNDGVPKITFKLRLFVKIKELEQNEIGEKQLESDNTYLTKALKEKTQEKIKEDSREIFNLIKSNNLDTLKVYSSFYKFKNKEFKKYLKTLENKEEYLQGIDFDVEVEVSER